MCLHVDFLPVFEGEPYIILAVDGHEVYQPTPKGSIEFIHQVSLRQGLQKGFDGSPSGLFAADCLIQRFIPGLRRTEQSDRHSVFGIQPGRGQHEHFRICTFG